MSPLVKVLAALLALVACMVAVGRRFAFAPAAGAGPWALFTRAGGSPGGGGRVTGPPPARVGHRLVMLVAVAMRAFGECGAVQKSHPEGGVTGWAASVTDEDEVDGLEDEILSRTAGTLHPQLVAYGTWQIEGAAVLAWALGLLDELPPYDEAADPSVLIDILGFPDADRTSALLRSLSLRSEGEIETEGVRLLSIHWRLRGFAATGEALDLASYRAGNPDGPLRFDQVPLVDDDLAVAGRSIADADAGAVEIAGSITAERLRALRWLREGGRYSDVAVD